MDYVETPDLLEVYVLPGSNIELRKNAYGLIEASAFGPLMLPEVKSEMEEEAETPSETVALSPTLGFPANSAPAPREAFWWIPVDVIVNRFSLGQKLEAVDSLHPDLWCATTIADVKGHRVCLHLDGYSSNYDFWVNCWDPFLRPVGWCAQTERRLEPPRGFDPSLFDWKGYLEMTSCEAVPNDRFDRSGVTQMWTRQLSAEADQSCPYKKNDVVTMADPFQPDGAVVIGKVTDVLDDKFVLVGAEDPSLMVFWATCLSPFIKPYTPEIESPECSQDSKPKSEPRMCKFEPNNIVEVVDPAHPCGIRTGLIKQVINNRLLIHLITCDSSAEASTANEDDFWLPVTSPDLYPCGFCAENGFMLDEHLAKDTKPARKACWEFADRFKRPQKSARESENDDEELVANDQPSSFKEPLAKAQNKLSLTLSSALAPLARRKRRKRRYQLTMPPKAQRLASQTLSLAAENADGHDLDSSPHFKNEIADGSNTGLYIPPSLYCGDLSPCWNLLPEFLGSRLPAAPQLLGWSAKQVGEFIRLLPGLASPMDVAELFAEEQIDGEALLLVSEQDLLELMRLTLGPALKISSCMSRIKNLYANALSENENGETSP